MRILHSMSWEKCHFMGDVENPNVEKVIRDKANCKSKSLKINVFEHAKGRCELMRVLFRSNENPRRATVDFLRITQGSNHICQKRIVLDGEN